MNIVISSFVIGFTAAALPGAVQTTVFLTTIENKIINGLRLALGAAVMDGLYLFLACYGLTVFISDAPVLRFLIGIMGVLFMLYLGIQGLRHSYKKSSLDENKKKSGGFLTGIVLVMLHIPTMFYFVGVAGSICRSNISISIALLNAFILFFGALSCFMCVSFIAWLSKRYGGIKFIRFLQSVSSLILIFFAIKIFLNLI